MPRRRGKASIEELGPSITESLRAHQHREKMVSVPVVDRDERLLVYDSTKLEQAILSLSPEEAEYASKLSDDLFYRYLAEHYESATVAGLKKQPSIPVGMEDNSGTLF